jgi:hypothetical protein
MRPEFDIDDFADAAYDDWVVACLDDEIEAREEDLARTLKEPSR